MFFGLEPHNGDLREGKKKKRGRALESLAVGERGEEEAAFRFKWKKEGEASGKREGKTLQLDRQKRERKEGRIDFSSWREKRQESELEKGKKKKKGEDGGEVTGEKRGRGNTLRAVKKGGGESCCEGGGGRRRVLSSNFLEGEGKEGKKRRKISLP